MVKFGGEGGPRRKTPEDITGANAEAARLARELGVASTPPRSASWLQRSWQRLTPPRTTTSSSNMSTYQDASTGSSHHVTTTSRLDTTNHSMVNSIHHPHPGTVSADQYHLMQEFPGSVASLAYLPPPALDSYPEHHHRHDDLDHPYQQQQQQPQRPQQQPRHRPSQQSSSIPPHATADTSSFYSDPVPPIEHSHDVPIYDAYGHRAPYKEGAYMISRDPRGNIQRKRWYGRLQDGYLAWSSIYLHEYFGFTIYMPLSTDEQAELKKEGGKIPNWMTHLNSLPNLAILMSYFCIGIALQLLRTPLIVYFIEDLNATPAEVNVLFTVMAVPWCFKVIYGFLSDCLPIGGLRRKPYFIWGWIAFIASNLTLCLYPFPNIQICILLVFTQTAGYMLADVMTDALIVERSRYETQETRGSMQSKGYIVRFFGSTIGATMGAVVYNKDDWSWYMPIRVVFFMNAAFPIIFLMPFVPYLLELETNCHPRNFWKQCQDLFQTAQLRSVWQPMTFVYIYNALQLTNAAWMNFLVEGLSFSAWQIGLVSIVGSIMAWFGIMTYERFFFASNWRIVYFWCTTLASAIALGQLILVFGINRSWGIPDIWFSMGDDVLVEFVIAVQFLPMCIMYLGLCPPGSEGTTYAMLTTWSNLAGSLAFDISTALTEVWDVSSDTIASGNYSGVWKLSLLCGLIGPVPLLLLGLIPKNKEDQRKLQQDNTRHYWAGVTFISVMILTLIITFVESIYEVYFNDESDNYDNQRRRLRRLLVGH